MTKKKRSRNSTKVVGRCLESDAHAQTIDEGFAFLDRPIINPREALAYQWALRNLALGNMRIKSESTREAIDLGTSYYSEGSIRVKAHILCGIATDIRFASDDPEANIDRIMMSFVKVFDERGHCWRPVDSHIWLFVDKLTVRPGEGWENRKEGGASVSRSATASSSLPRTGSMTDRRGCAATAWANGPSSPRVSCSV